MSNADKRRRYERFKQAQLRKEKREMIDRLWAAFNGFPQEGTDAIMELSDVLRQVAVYAAKV